MERRLTLRRIARCIDSWWRAAFTLDVRGLAVFRMGIGMVLVADCLLRWRTFPLMFAADGIFPPDLLREFHGTPARWSLAFACPATWWAGAVLALQGAAGLLVAAGCRTRLATIAAWIATVSVMHRTAPATYSGDEWLACLLLWSMFLPLGAAWSLDSRRARSTPSPTAVCSIASMALVLQIAVVYLGAGLSKCNGTWFSGEALGHALSVHDHGNRLGMLVAGIDWLVAPATWVVLAAELAAPFALVLVPVAGIRCGLAAAFVVFHLAVWATMSVGLFAAIGIAAWTALVPARAWDRIAPRRAAPRHSVVTGLARGPAMACGMAVVVAGGSFAHARGWLGPGPLPGPFRSAIAATCLAQHWSMFGAVPPQEQWVYGRATLVDGRVVDLLRGGRAVTPDRPPGGFGSLAGQRWHKVFWVLPRADMRRFAGPTAAAIARDWNARHAAREQVSSLELHYAVQRTDTAEPPLMDILLAAWPPRGDSGRGNLDRLLEDRLPEATSSEPPAVRR